MRTVEKVVVCSAEQSVCVFVICRCNVTDSAVIDDRLQLQHGIY